MRASRSIALAGLLAASGCGAAGFRLAQPVEPWSVVEPVDDADHDLELGRVRFRPDVCRDVDLRPADGPLDEASLVAFLRARHVEVQSERARGDLVYLDLTDASLSAPLRLRVAILADADAAGVELHRALGEHGPGSFGVHRGNVAVLGPRGRLADLIGFAARTKLPCWGVFTVEGADEAFVVGGGYLEP